MGETASDRFVVPLCRSHHLDGEDAQHKSGEVAFWKMHGIDPCDVALALWGCSGDEDAGELVVKESRARAKGTG